MVTFKKHFLLRKHALWQIFVAAAFPIHVWSIILALRDIPWVAERTNIWDAIGVAGYELVFSLLESLLIWVVAVLFGSLLLRNWSENKRVSVLSVLILVTILGAICGQYVEIVQLPFSSQIGAFLTTKQNPMWLIYGALSVIILPIVLSSAYFAAYSDTCQNVVPAILDRIAPLMVLYLSLDALGLIMILIRNFA